MKRLLIVCIALTMFGCAMTTTEIDSFDGSTNVTQTPFVVTSAKFGMPGTQLGFRWKSTVPNYVVLDIGLQGTHPVRQLAFNIDGKIITMKKPLNAFTDYQSGGMYPGWSFNSFMMQLSNFRQLAVAQTVKMKVSTFNKYTVGEFGRKKSMKYIDQSDHFDKFLSQVDAQLKK